MTRVRMETDAATATMFYGAGDVVELDDETARRYVERGYALPVESAPLGGLEKPQPQRRAERRGGRHG